MAGPTLPVDEQLRIVRTGAVDLITEDDFRRKLGSGRSLRIKLGIDPTASDIHLGFAVVLRKLRQFQELGHTAVLIIGDFTAQVGDPSGKSATRPRLSKEEVEGFAASYVEQARRILLDEPLEIRRNSEWLGTMGIEDVLRLAARTTVARMLERDDFSRRYRDGVAISVMEFLYPLLQGWDSVMVEADVELGGTDQLFNNLMGRTLQGQEGQEGQCVLTTPLLEGLDGVNKMSKSLGNYIAITEPPDEMFGKLMSISDDLMWRYFDLLSFRDNAALTEIKRAVAEGKNPRDVKFELAKEIVARFHDQAAADAALERFQARFQRSEVPTDLPVREVACGEDRVKLANVLRDISLSASASAAYRDITAGAVRVNGEKVSDTDALLSVGETVLVQVGKRKFAQIKLVRK
jgi:tyrosyl-tRNA synthetase